MKTFLKFVAVPWVMYIEWYSLMHQFAFNYLGIQGDNAVIWPIALTLVAIWVVSIGYICDL